MGLFEELNKLLKLQKQITCATEPKQVTAELPSAGVSRYQNTISGNTVQRSSMLMVLIDSQGMPSY